MVANHSSPAGPQHVRPPGNFVEELRDVVTGTADQLVEQLNALPGEPLDARVADDEAQARALIADRAVYGAFLPAAIVYFPAAGLRQPLLVLAAYALAGVLITVLAAGRRRP
jgi:hypothetical protein